MFLPFATDMFASPCSAAKLCKLLAPMSFKLGFDPLIVVRPCKPERKPIHCLKNKNKKKPPSSKISISVRKRF